MNLLFIFFLFTWSVILHECGHIIAFKLIASRDIEIRCSLKKGIESGKIQDYHFLRPEQRILQNIIAICVGIIPLFWINELGAFIIVILLYLLGCRQDLLNIKTDFKKMEDYTHD